MDHTGGIMTGEINPTDKKTEKFHKNVQVQSGDTVYTIGMIGAWVYYIGKADTTEEKVKGFLKGLVWPAFLVYRLLEFFDKE
jgi:hypothetical protein